MRPSRYRPKAQPGESAPNLVNTESIRRATLSGSALWAFRFPLGATPTSTRAKMAYLQFIPGDRPRKVYPRMYTLHWLAATAALAGLLPRAARGQATVDPDPNYQG